MKYSCLTRAPDLYAYRKRKNVLQKKATMSVAPNGYKQKAKHVIVSCPCGYRHRYPLSTSTAYLMDQCDLHDEICAASGSDLNNAQT